MGSGVHITFRTTASTPEQASAVDFLRRRGKEKGNESVSTTVGGSCVKEEWDVWNGRTLGFFAVRGI